jgi:PhnB protein
MDEAKIKYWLKIKSTKNSNRIVQPYLFFDGRCEEAIEFYRKTLGAEVEALIRYKDSPDPSVGEPGTGDKIMHASFRVGATTLLASDGQCQGTPNFQGFSLSLTASDEAEAERLFAALGEGGQEQMPLSKTFFSPRFGMVADRFGVSWMIYVPPAEQK